MRMEEGEEGEEDESGVKFKFQRERDRFFHSEEKREKIEEESEERRREEGNRISKKVNEPVHFE
jgi:hypothetical protein